MVHVMMNSASIVVNLFSKHSVPEGNSQMRSRFLSMVPLEPSLVSGTQKMLNDHFLDE